MTCKLSTATRSVIASAFFVAGMAGVAFAQDSSGDASQAQPPKGWFKACTKQADNDVCITQNLKAASNGQLVTAVGLITVKGKANQKLLQVSVPSARLIQPGIAMQIDDNKKQQLGYAVCMPDKCVAEVPLSDGLVNAFKRGGQVTFTSVNFRRQPNPVEVSLKGFTDAFEGAPMKQSELQQRQKLLQQQMQKKADTARQQLEQAQEKAKKQGN
ncbi:invasion associated locus B family protein [Pararhizobium mangrovi]|uniref:Invasion associated locus B family protein n=1 Tax=Pararhizobium mangrovi TaxID=2590452 RepID=A0A506UG30_9HYPH|nr:invasion associated locus B family protein [Pararhizobium mangrovi]TPW31929.1 invasion associated locus B family protein [Pararhizobium mangrovi]